MKICLLAFILLAASCQKETDSLPSSKETTGAVVSDRLTCSFEINERDTFDIGPAGEPILKEFIGVGNRWIYTDSIFTTHFEPAHCRFKVYAVSAMSVNGEQVPFIIVSAVKKNGQLPAIPIEPYIVYRKDFQPFNKEVGDNFNF